MLNGCRTWLILSTSSLIYSFSLKFFTYSLSIKEFLPFGAEFVWLGYQHALSVGYGHSGSQHHKNYLYLSETQVINLGNLIEDILHRGPLFAFVTVDACTVERGNKDGYFEYFAPICNSSK